MTSLGPTGISDARRFEGKRKLFLVPLLPVPPGLEESHSSLLDKHWDEIGSHIENLERTLGTVKHVFHEMLYESGENAETLLQQISSRAWGIVERIVHSSATLQKTEDADTVFELTDWQRCMSIGLVSAAAAATIGERYQEAAKKRFAQISTNIDEVIGKDESALILISEDHRVQFPTDIQVFYVSPPTHNELKQAIRTYFQEQQSSGNQDVEDSS